MANKNSKTVYSATYSNVPVFEFNIGGNHVMRRRSDDWINATHILKVADYDKPARTRILEREVQKGVHEKVQGGYGKYQGTWIPLPDGRELASKNGVLEKLLPIFSFVPGDRSPPPAPKHETAATSKPRGPRQPAQARKAAAATAAPAVSYHHNQVQDYDALDVRDHEIPDDETAPPSESHYSDYDYDMAPAHPRKRRRTQHDGVSQADREHHLWSEELLDYFMLAEDNTMDAIPMPPVPPTNGNLNRPIDEKGYTALHWAAAMGDTEVVKDLIRRGARIDCLSKSGETPLMRSVMFTNCYDKRNMEKLASLLLRTVSMQMPAHGSGGTVFHAIASLTQSRRKYDCARYYLDCLLAKISESLPPGEVERVLNERDAEGDTAVTIAARNGARKCVRSLIGRNAAVDIVNQRGETADQLIVALNYRRRERDRGVGIGLGGSSSPPASMSFLPEAFGAPAVGDASNAHHHGPLHPRARLETGGSHRLPGEGAEGDHAAEDPWVHEVVSSCAAILGDRVLTWAMRCVCYGQKPLRQQLH
ncbi:Transcription factor mbp1 [Teratosphaeriaceae sp. CCFEE 6253]|nr:Transcription factor mbp1 [Teratosphaeriaceae sp. CCFEE 6253]